MPEFDWRSPESYKSLQNAEITDIAWECLRRNADYQRDYEAMIANSPDGEVTAGIQEEVGYLLSPMTRRGHSTSRPSFGRLRFCRLSFQSRSRPVARQCDAPPPLLDLAAGQVRRAADGWHAVLRIGAVEHRVWSKEPPTARRPLRGRVAV